jgi:hypothetical protein
MLARDLMARVTTRPLITLLGRFIAKGSVYRFELDKMLTGMSRRVSVDQLLNYAAGNGWLVVNGQRISPVRHIPSWSRQPLLGGR